MITRTSSRRMTVALLCTVPGCFLSQGGRAAPQPVAAPRATAGRASTIPAVSGKPVQAFAQRHIETRIGIGTPVRPRACLYAHYTGWLTDGTRFDSSRDTLPNGLPRAPIAFAQGAKRVIIGWDAGFDGMKVGGQRRLFIPYQLGYGETGRLPTIPPKAELIFDVELMAVADTLARTQPVTRGQPAAPPACPSWDSIKP